MAHPQTIASRGFNDSQELATYLLDYAKKHTDAPMYVKDEHGNEFNCVEVIESKLSDGSLTLDVLLRTR